MKEEEKKGEDLNAIKSLNMDTLMETVDNKAKQAPWRQALVNKESVLHKTLFGDLDTLFSKKFTLFYELAKSFDISNDPAKPVTAPIELPLISGDAEILLAIYLQNMLQPKNAQRRDAVTNGTYVSILASEQAARYLTEILQENMKNRAQARTKVLIADAQKLLSNRGFNLMIQAPDFYHAAAVLIQSKLRFADRNKIFEEIIDKGDAIIAFKDKLRLLNMDYYQEHRLYVDGYVKGKEEERAEATRQIHYKVWLELVRRRRQITTNEFKAIFPEAGYKIDLWNECVDQNGDPKLNPKKFWEYVNNWKKNKREGKARRKAEEAAKKKF